VLVAGTVCAFVGDEVVAAGVVGAAVVAGAAGAEGAEGADGAFTGFAGAGGGAGIVLPNPLGVMETGWKGEGGGVRATIFSKGLGGIGGGVRATVRKSRLVCFASCTN